MNPRHRLIRAAHFVRESHDPFGQMRIASILEKTPLELSPHAFSRLKKMGLGEAARTCLRQRLVTTVIYKHLLPELLLHLHQTNEPVVAGLPKAWRKRLHDLRIPFQKTFSQLKWGFTLILFYLFGVRTSLQLLKSGLQRSIPPKPASPYAVLMNLNANNLPPPRLLHEPSYDFVTWYRTSAICDPRVTTLWAHLPQSKQSTTDPQSIKASYFFPQLEGRLVLFQFVFRLLLLLSEVLIKGLRGAWWEVVLLEQQVHLTYALMMKKDDFARSYVFNNSYLFLRPLWSYLAEAAGSTIDLVFYATNVEPFGLSPSDPRPYWPGYQGMTWQRYGVWDDYQAALVRSWGYATEPVVILGPVGFTDGNLPLPNLPPEYVVIFDVTPQRSDLWALRGMPQPYYTASMATQFLEDIAEALAINRLGMVHKRKREIGKIAEVQYREALEKILKNENTVAVDPDIAAQHLIEKSIAVISMPFTSTALTARAMGKPSIYYDPLGILMKEERLAHGIPIIGDKKSLITWLRSLHHTSTAAEGHRVAAR